MRFRRPPAEFGEADAELAEVLAELEGAGNYKAWLLELIAPHVRGRILEIGAGRGTYTHELRMRGTALTAVEPSVQASVHLRQRAAQLPDVTTIEGTLADVNEHHFDSAVMLNVLEHIDDDVGALQQVHARLVPGGVLCIWVPAFPALYGRFDRRIGHHRRYRRREIISRARRAGFELVDCHFANLPGFFAWFVVVRMFGKSPTSGGLSSVYDRLIVPVTRVVERRLRPPFGQSLLLVVRKPTSGLTSTTHLD